MCAAGAENELSDPLLVSELFCGPARVANKLP
jgi:hypothetical protein